MKNLSEKLRHAAREGREGMRRAVVAMLTGVMLFTSMPVEALAEGTQDIMVDAATAAMEVASDAAGANDGANGPSTPTGDTTTGDVSQEPALASYTVTNDLAATTIEGDATASKEAAAEALRRDAGLDEQTARDAADALFYEYDESEDVGAPVANALPSDGSGDDVAATGSDTLVDKLVLTWMTPDSEYVADESDEDTKKADFVDYLRDDDALLYYRPTSDAKQALRMRVSFSLSGEHDYAPGDISISVPTYMFTGRDNKVQGTMVLAVPENPSTTGEWSYKRDRNQYVITNTRTMDAATQGYIEFAVEDIVPHDLVDFKGSKAFTAKIDVVTDSGEVVSRNSGNELYAYIDTHAEVTSATKRQSGEIEVVEASEIPEAQRMEGETHYVVVTWYMNAFVPTDATSSYTLELTDTVGETEADAKDVTLPKGFIIDEQAAGENAHPAETTMTVVDNGFKSGDSAYSQVRVAYPHSKFEKDHIYTFSNSVAYKLTETDDDAFCTDAQFEGDLMDKKKVTTAEADAKATWHYEDPVFIEPSGHYNVFKYGVCATTYGDGLETFRDSDGGSVSDLSYMGVPGWSPYNGYWGQYPSALNDLHNGEDTTVTFTINSVGYLFPWTYEAPKGSTSGNPQADLDNYGKRSVTMTTEDTGMKLMETTSLTPGEDYVYESVEFPRRPNISKVTAIRVSADGNVYFGSANDGAATYVTDDDFNKTPDVILQVKRGDTWKDYVRASWSKTSDLELTYLTTGPNGESEGTEIADTRVPIPADVTGVRTQVTASNASVRYYIRVHAKLLADGAVAREANHQFDDLKATNPNASVWNYTTMTATQPDAEDPTKTNTIVSIDKYAFVRLMGYTTDMRASLSKTSSKPDLDYDSRQATIHYTTRLAKQSFISDARTFAEAMASGDLEAENGGTFYDLLPKGMVPVLDTVELRDGDRIRELYTIEDYQGSGRTLLVVSADLDPQTVPYEEADLTYYEDLVTLEFDAVYSFSALLDFGNNPHNVVAYRSDNKTLGTIAGYQGEAGPTGTDGAYNSNTTQAAMRDDEVDLMQAVAQLAGSQGEENWLYAGADCNLETVDYGLQGLTKEVMVNNNGVWTTGVEANGDPCDVYAGGTYQYRLGVRSGEESTTKDIVLYDVLEAYEPTGSNNEGIDENAPSWRGTLTGVDVSSLVEAGCAPTVYVSTQPQLVLEEGGVATPGEDASVRPDEDATELSNKAIWLPLSSETDLSQVTAVAIDARKAADGSDFVLDAEKSLGAYITMRAPSGAKAEQLIASDAHAFNNVYLASTTQGKNEGEPHNDFVRRDYTKVGLEAYELDVRKAWGDDNDRDGLRPDAVTVHLYADLQDGEGARPAEQALPAISAEAAAKTLSAENDWQTTFSSLPYYADSGDKIIYSVREENVPEGYEASVAFDGEAFTVTNRHETAQVTVSGTKNWVGDTDAVRPDAIEVELLADGRVVETATVRADANGAWKYSFDGLDKYTAGDDGDPREIEYTVREKAGTAPSYTSEVTGDATNGFTITNAYNPYGHLKVSKTVEGASSVVQDKTYTFTFEFTRDGEPETGALAWLKSLFTGEQEVPQEPVFDDFTYRVFNAADVEQAGRTGTVRTNGSLELKAGEYAVVYDIPEGVHYTVIEASAAGFTQASTGAVGTITPNETVEARFVNTYAAEGVAYLEAKKQLTGRELTPYQFMFSVYEVAEDGSETLVRTASNGAADEGLADVDEQGNPVSVAPVTFGGITYTAQDSGKTFKYRIAETATAQGGYTCDTTSYYAYVTPTDNGDGTMDVEVTYKTAEDQAIEDPGNIQTGVVFRNDYVATGSLGLQVHKELHGGTLAAGQFTFELGRVDNADADTPTFTKLSTANNAADGSVTFDDINFNQRDIGKTYIYAIREVAGNDSAEDGGTVVYDEHVAYVQATIADNGNGTLSVGTKFSGFEVPCVTCVGSGTVEDDTCPACNGSGNVTASTDDLTFENSMVDGRLEIVKTVPEGENVDPNQPFTFHVELTNEQGEELDVENIAKHVTIDPVGGDDTANAELDAADDGTMSAADQEDESADDASTPTAPASAASNPVLDFFSGAADFLIGLVAPTPAYAYWAGDDEAWHDEGTWQWNFDGSTLTLAGKGIACTKHSDDYHAFTWSGEGNSPYPEQDSFNASEVYKVVFEEGATFGPNISRLFDGMKNLQTIVGLEHMDTSNVTDMSYMFNLCSKVDSDDLKAVASFKTSNVTDMRGMFYGCSKLDKLDVSNFDTSSVTKMTSMFSGCKMLKELDVSKFETSRVTSMASMFNGCSSLGALDVSKFNTENVTSMASMFKNCSGLSGELDLSGFSFDKVTTFANMFEGDEELTQILFPEEYGTPSLTNMESMFSGCAQVKSLDISQFNTSKVTSLAWVFNNCKSIESLDLSRWVTSSVTDMKYLFSNCNNLGRIDFPESGWDTSKVKSMTQLFYRTAVTSLDLSSWDTSNVEKMNSMFSYCSDLETITFGDSFSLENVTSIASMFSKCASLNSVDLTRFVSNGSLDMSYLFSGCSSLTEIDLSGLTGQAEDIEGMFENCAQVRSIDIGGLTMRTDEYWEYYRAFAKCNNLSSITLSEKFEFYHGGSTYWPNIEAFPSPKVGSGAWVKLDESGKPQMNTAMSHNALWNDYPNVTGGAGTWVWNSFIDIKFHANGGTGSMPNQSIDSLQTVTLNKNEDSITKPNALFEGWNTSADGTGDFYADGATIEAETFMEKADSVTLYAQWRDLQSVIAGTDGVLTITMPAGYHAVIPNLPAGTSYRVWEETESGWQLVETSGTAGAILPNETVKASFTNSQVATSAYARIAAKKLLDGAWASTEDGFQFTLTDTTEGSSQQGSVVQTKTVGAGGNVEFDPIAYSAPGVYTYELREVEGNDATIDYDKTVVSVTVTVEADGDSHLTASVAYGDLEDDEVATTEVPVFENTTKPGSLTIKKTVADNTPQTALQTEFTFKLMLAGLPYEGTYTVGDESRKAADGIITLKANETATLAGLAPGTSYAVEEVNVPDGWTLSKDDGTTGSIASDDTARATFTNTYAATGSVQLMAYKSMPNGAIADGQFEFELLDANDKVLYTAVNGPVDTSTTIPSSDGDGWVWNPAYGKAAVWFPAIAYTQEHAGKTFTYTMREVVPGEAVNASGVHWDAATDDQKAAGGFALDGICYDSSERTATVTVADNGDGTLDCAVAYQDSDGNDATGNTFVNILETTGLTVKKVVTNGNLDRLAESVQNATFTFTISLKSAAGAGLEDVVGVVQSLDEEGEVSSSKNVTVSDGGTFALKANEQVVFDDLPYGTTYEVIETPQAGWTQVADQTSGTHGTLTSEGAVATFANRYDARGVAELKAYKEFDGTPTDGQFSFALLDTTAGMPGTWLQDATNDAEGNVAFEPIAYTTEDAGKTFSYQIFETNTVDSGIAFDKSVVEVKVSVTDRGDGTLQCDVTYNGEAEPYTFKNWLAVTLARTGGPGITLAGVALVALGCIALALHKRNAWRNERREKAGR